MSELFDFRLQARRPATFLWLAAGTAAAAAAAATGLPTLSAAIVLAAVLPAFWRICINARRGFTLGPRVIELYAPGGHRVIPIPRIDRVQITGLSRGLACELVLTTGETLRLPAPPRACPTAIGDAFRARGIPVIA